MNNSNNNRSILVLDDELNITTIAKQSLQGLGFRVSAFTDPLIALEYFKLNFNICCGMVISAIRIRGKKGQEFAKKIKGIKSEGKMTLMSAFEINDIEFSSVLPDVKVMPSIKSHFL